MAQTRTVCGMLAEKFPELETEIVVIKTSGDWAPADGEVRLSETEGGKGLFAKEIEAALLAGEIDAAVHSMKDMDSNLPEGLVIDHMLPREDPRDALLFSNEIRSLAEFGQYNRSAMDVIPDGCLVGTASVRRSAFLLARRPDLAVAPFRGNVGTRIEKVRKGQVGCTCLAMAGLNRLDLSHEADFIFEVDEMLPAAGQGAVGIEARAEDAQTLSIIGQISDLNTVHCVKAERAALRVLDGSCHTPIGAYAVIDPPVPKSFGVTGTAEIWLRVAVVSEDGSQSFADEIRGKVTSFEDAIALGETVGERLKLKIPKKVLGHG